MGLINVYGDESGVFNFDNFGKNVTQHQLEPMFMGDCDGAEEGILTTKYEIHEKGRCRAGWGMGEIEILITNDGWDQKDRRDGKERLRAAASLRHSRCPLGGPHPNGGWRG